MNSKYFFTFIQRIFSHETVSSELVEDIFLIGGCKRTKDWTWMEQEQMDTTVVTDLANRQNTV